MQQISKIICSTYVTNGHVKRQRRKTLTVLQRTCSPKGKVQHSFLSRFLSLSSSRALSWPTFAQLSEATGLLAFTVNRLQPWLIMFRCLGIVVYFYSPYSTVSFWVPLSFFASFFSLAFLSLPFQLQLCLAWPHCSYKFVCGSHLPWKITFGHSRSSKGSRTKERRRLRRIPWNNGLKERETRNEKRQTNCARRRF